MSSSKSTSQITLDALIDKTLTSQEMFYHNRREKCIPMAIFITRKCLRGKDKDKDKYGTNTLEYIMDTSKHKNQYTDDYFKTVCFQIVNIHDLIEFQKELQNSTKLQLRKSNSYIDKCRRDTILYNAISTAVNLFTKLPDSIINYSEKQYEKDINLYKFARQYIQFSGHPKEICFDILQNWTNELNSCLAAKEQNKDK